MKHIIIIILLLSNVSYAKNTKDRIAVLNIKSNILSKDEKVFYTELIRKNVLSVKNLILITKENITALLEPGTNIEECVGTCEVETGRKVGAKYVITSEVLKVNSQYCFYIKIHDVITSEALFTKDACHLNTNLSKKINDKSKELIKSLFENDSYFYSSLTRKDFEDTNKLFLVNFDIKPGDAKVFINGIQYNNKSMSIAKGQHDIVVKRKDYYTIRKTINVNRDEQFYYELKPKFGNLYVFDKIFVRVNGKKEKTPFNIKTKKGKKYKIEILDKCYEHEKIEVTLKEGESKIINPTKKKVKVTILSENILGEQIKGDVYMGSVKIGRTPLEKYIWVCNNTLSLSYKDSVSIFETKNLDKTRNRNIIFKVKTRDSFIYNREKFVYKKRKKIKTGIYEDNEIFDINDDKQVIKKANSAYRKSLLFREENKVKEREEDKRYVSKEYSRYLPNNIQSGFNKLKSKDNHLKHSFYGTILTSSFIVTGLGMYNAINCNKQFLSDYCKKDVKYYASAGMIFVGISGVLISSIAWAYDYKCHWLTGFQKYKSCPKERKNFNRLQRKTFEIMLILDSKKSGSINLKYNF